RSRRCRRCACCRGPLDAHHAGLHWTYHQLVTSLDHAGGLNPGSVDGDDAARGHHAQHGLAIGMLDFAMLEGDARLLQVDVAFWIRTDPGDPITEQHLAVLAIGE